MKHSSPSAGPVRLPIFFRLWFAFVLVLSLCVWGAAAYVIFTMGSHLDGLERMPGAPASDHGKGRAR
ncbi:hypothetical protein [Methylobacterium nigriterrae]|uniref:hypothetical protein n=1 Tax=Methylobacterium nigriterrae TaxID=3127512 RepID=UPI0030132B0C